MLEDTFSKQFTFPNYIRQTFHLPKEEVKVMNTTLWLHICHCSPEAPLQECRLTANTDSATPTYRLCGLLKLWVPSLGRMRARQPLLLSTMSEPGQQQDWCERRAAQREGEEALTHQLLRAGTDYKGNRLLTQGHLPATLPHRSLQ